MTPLFYTEASPSSALSGSVECYWSIRGDAQQPVQNRVLPDGCMDIIFALGGEWVLPRASVVGTMRRALCVRHTGRVDLLGIRFRPGRAASILGVPATELTGSMVELGAILPGDVWLSDALASVPSDPVSVGGALAGAAVAERSVLASRARLLERWLLSRGPDPGARADALVVSALQWIHESRGSIRVRELERRLGTSERTLGRRFAAAVGLSPKEASRVTRFLCVARTLEREPGAILAQVAAAAGFADQAHLTRDFAELAGITPAAFIREPSVTRSPPPDGFLQDTSPRTL